MVALFGREFSRAELSAHSGDMAQFAGVRLMVLGDGAERGIRMLEFRSGSGLRFTVLVDRCLDIAECEYRGRAIGWHGPSGFRHPALHEYEGEGGLSWMRSFSGLMVTCGLDHILFMHDAPAAEYNYGPRTEVKHSLHGRAGTIPARLTGYGETWEGDRCTLWCEGVVRQATMFGEHLELTRRIEIDAGTSEIRLTDRVENRGFNPTPHMYCYHINLGHPLLGEGARYLAPVRDVVWAAHAGADYRAQGVGYRRLTGPQPRFHEQVWQHELAAGPDGTRPVALVNDAAGLGFEVTTDAAQFPCMFEWQALQAGQYGFGIEPSTNHVLGQGYAAERGELITLGHGEARRYDTRLRVLDGAAEIAACEARVTALATQPEEDFPEPSGHHLPLRAGA
ncbi:aldose 1-epimerase family protein [Oceanicella sp. SM1341]|uniref:aldose 1-epimerase family protein n=1 Tax=Oceanicella sp. SM1341 TaxID=1548889 RepID=UPI000E489D1A|nr:aldose 1-epimerase family protein [Oceanicella sp. SM1341]